MLSLLCTVCLALAINAENIQENQGFRYMPPRSVMMGGYYGMPLFKYLNFPSPNEESIPAAPEEEFQDERQVDIEDSVAAPEEEKQITEDSTTSPEKIDIPLRTNETNNIAKKISTKKSKSKPFPDEEDSIGSSFPFGSGNSSFFNTFFPIMVGGRSGVSRKSGEDGSFGGATAIANSFSTGRGGVANSHATSFGDVYMSSSLRERNDRIRKKYD